MKVFHGLDCSFLLVVVSVLSLLSLGSLNRLFKGIGNTSESHKSISNRIHIPIKKTNNNPKNRNLWK